MIALLFLVRQVVCVSCSHTHIIVKDREAMTLVPKDYLSEWTDLKGRKITSLNSPPFIVSLVRESRTPLIRSSDRCAFCVFHSLPKREGETKKSANVFPEKKHLCVRD